MRETHAKCVRVEISAMRDGNFGDVNRVQMCRSWPRVDHNVILYLDGCDHGCNSMGFQTTAAETSMRVSVRDAVRLL